jgi:hypothetical protein
MGVITGGHQHILAITEKRLPLTSLDCQKVLLKPQTFRHARKSAQVSWPREGDRYCCTAPAEFI